MGASVRVVAGAAETARLETFDLDSGVVLDSSPFGTNGRGPIPLSISIIIRAKNEAQLIGQVLDAIGQQLGGRRDGGLVQVIVVDNESTDGTLDIAMAHADVLVQLPREQWSYGHALNVGIAEASGAIGVSLAAHAVPADTLWLANLVAPFAADPSVAGVFGRDVPWPHAPLADRLRSALAGPYSGHQAREAGPIRQRYWNAITFSNSNGAFRRSLALAVPFCEVVPGSEDSLWANAQIDRGYRVLYQPTARVWHSHFQRLGDLVWGGGQLVVAHAQARQGACPN
jgi:rhamnosyltransferase